MNRGKKRIILVDDNMVNLRMGKILLEKDYSVITAPSAQKLFHLLELKSNIPDLILLDIDMPGMNGFETIKQLKSNPTTEKIPVIYLSAHSEIHEVHKGFSLGAIDYIRKPYEPQLLLDRIEKVLFHLA